MSASSTVYGFTRFGMGEGDPELQKILAVKFLKLFLQTGEMQAVIVFYTDGERLACQGSSVLDELRQLEERGVRQTCLDYASLVPSVGLIGGMRDILEAKQKAGKGFHL